MYTVLKPHDTLCYITTYFKGIGKTALYMVCNCAILHCECKLHGFRPRLVCKGILQSHLFSNAYCTFVSPPTLICKNVHRSVLEFFHAHPVAYSYIEKVRHFFSWIIAQHDLWLRWNFVNCTRHWFTTIKNSSVVHLRKINR